MLIVVMSSHLQAEADLAKATDTCLQNTEIDLKRLEN